MLNFKVAENLLFSKIFFTIIVFSLSIIFIQSQYTVSGNIVDNEGKGIFDAQVTLLPQNLVVQTDKIGYFQFKNVSAGEYTLEVYKINFDTYDQSIKVGAEDLDLGQVKPNYNPSSIDQGIITLTDDEIQDEASQNQTGVSLLQASRDVFSRTAAFELGGYWFKGRGLDNRYLDIFIDGVRMNKRDNGRVTFGDWGGLNDVTRYPMELVEGSRASDYAFGALSSTTYFNTKASNFRKGTRLTYSATNRSYRNRLMFSHFSGVNEKGWSYALSASRRWAEEGLIEGTYYDAYGYFFSVEKKINENNSINFTTFGAPGRRSSNSPNTQEVYDLKGKNYNSYWGWDDGEKRNERVKKYFQPYFSLVFDSKFDDKSALKTTVSYQTGYTSGSRLDWFNAPSPSPTYYRNLPSWGRVIGYSPETIDYMTERWLGDQNYSQINWENMYHVNFIQPETTIDGTTGRTALYYLVDDVNEDNIISATTHYTREMSKDWDLYINLNYQNIQSANYRELTDLLGADFALNEDDFNDNAALGPNRIVREGDKFQYYYDIYSNNFSANLRSRWTVNENFTLDVEGLFNYNDAQRDGKYRNQIYPDNSAGKSEKVRFLNAGLKSQVMYKINGRNFLLWNSTWSSQSPVWDEIFPNPRMNNLVTPNIRTQKINSNELSYVLRSPKIKARVTGFYTTINDAIEVTRYYAQGLALTTPSGQEIAANAFVAEILNDVDKRYLGTEIGLEYNATSTLTVSGIASIGNYVYNNNPDLYLSIDDITNQGVYELGKSYLKDYKLGNGPQIGSTFALRYSSPQYWWAGSSINYLANNYLDVSPILRTEGFTTDPTTGNPYYNSELGRYINNDDVRNILRQEKFSNEFMWNVSIGKSWKFGKYYIGLSANINNILDNRDYVTGGFEQGRNANFNNLFEDRERSQPIFAPKLWYDRGRTYFINLYFRF